MANSVIQFSPKSLQRVSEANQEDSCQVTIFSHQIPIKRFFLPVVGCLGLVAFPVVRTYMYLPVLVFVVFFVIFWNFPYIITFMNSKPLYYEDLFVTGSTPPQTINIKVRRKFECAFEWSLFFTNALFTAALSEYWLYQAGSAKSYVEIVGVTGGILKIFQSINHMNGGIILHVTRSFIDKELNHSSAITGSVTMIELQDFDDSIEVSRNKAGSTHSVDIESVLAITDEASGQVYPDVQPCDQGLS